MIAAKAALLKRPIAQAKKGLLRAIKTADRLRSEFHEFGLL